MALFYMASIINMTNCVEYNEYKRGERNEAVVSTLRPLMAKFADAMKYGIITLVLIVSAVYGLSQNISTVEAQKGYFDRMTVTEQKEYLSALSNYLYDFDSANVDFDQLNEQLAQDSVLKGRQIDAQYLEAIGDMAIMEHDGDEVRFVKYVKQYGGATSWILSENCTYTLELKGTANGVEFNVANDHFRDQGNLSMRLWIRAAVTVVPMLFLFAALMVQHKKFIIDEDYYDMMMAEINSRKPATATADTPAEATETTEE